MRPTTRPAARRRHPPFVPLRAFLGRAASGAAACLLVLAGTMSGQARPAADEDEILSVVQGLFDAMAERDTAAARELLAPGARFLRIAVDADTAVRQWRDADAFLRGIAADGPTLRETIHDPRVTTDGPHATVRAPYRFRVDGDFSHCGTNVFHLTRGPDGWVLAAVAYTVRPEPSACPGGRPDASRPGSTGRETEVGTGHAHGIRRGARR